MAGLATFLRAASGELTGRLHGFSACAVAQLPLAGLGVIARVGKLHFATRAGNQFGFKCDVVTQLEEFMEPSSNQHSGIGRNLLLILGQPILKISLLRRITLLETLLHHRCHRGVFIRALNDRLHLLHRTLHLLLQVPRHLGNVLLHWFQTLPLVGQILGELFVGRSL